MLTLVYASDGDASELTGRPFTTWYDENGERFACAFRVGASHHVNWPGIGIFAFSLGSTEVRVSAAPDASQQAIEDTFSRVLQPIILQALGWQAIHASAVTGPSGVWGFCARSGSGKSTLAFAFQRAGFTQFADDAVVLSVRTREVIAHPLPFIPRLERASFEYFATRPAERVQAGVSPMPMAAVFLLRRNPAPSQATTVTRLNPAPAFSALLAHAHCFDALDKVHVSKLTADYLMFAETVPIFSCSYRPGFDYLPELIDRIQEAGVSLPSISQCLSSG